MLLLKMRRTNQSYSSRPRKERKRIMINFEKKERPWLKDHSHLRELTTAFIISAQADQVQLSPQEAYELLLWLAEQKDELEQFTTQALVQDLEGIEVHTLYESSSIAGRF